MRKFLTVLCVLLVSVFLLVACAPATVGVQSLAQLPDNARMLVLFLLTSAVTWLLRELSLLISRNTPIDLTQYAEPIAAALAPLIVSLLEYVLNFIPGQFDSIVLAVINYLVLLIGGAIGMFLFAKRLKDKELPRLLS